MSQLKRNSRLHILFASTMIGASLYSSTAALATVLEEQGDIRTLPISATIDQEAVAVQQFCVHITNCSDIGAPGQQYRPVHITPIDMQAQQQQQIAEADQSAPLSESAPPNVPTPPSLPKPSDSEPEPYANLPGPAVPPSVQPTPAQPGLAAPPMPEPAAPHLAPAPPPMPQPANPPPLSQRPDLNPATPGAPEQKPPLPSPPSSPSSSEPEPTAYESNI